MTPRSVVITAAQADVLRELCETGADARTIGQRLYMSETAVRKQLHRIYQASGYHDRTALAVAVLRGDIRPAVRGRDSWWKENAA